MLVSPRANRLPVRAWGGGGGVGGEELVLRGGGMSYFKIEKLGFSHYSMNVET